MLILDKKLNLKYKYNFKEKIIIFNFFKFFFT